MGEVKKRINGNLNILEKSLLTGTINGRLLYMGCQKNVPIEDRFLLQTFIPPSYFRNIIMTSGINIG